MNRTDVEIIKERLPINEVIGQYIKLEKSGGSYKAKCPFHNEKSASFFVSPDRGGYYCFGCNAKGDIFTFVEQFEGLDFRGALKVLAEKAGVQLTNNKKADGERDRLFQVMETATQYFEAQLKVSKEASAYVKKRGITDTTRSEFRIGWAPEGWSNLHMFLKKKGFDDAILEKAGLIKRKETGGQSTEIRDQRLETGKSSISSLQSPVSNLHSLSPSFYDRFRGRVIFPVNDSSGRPIAFSGRILKDDGKSAKYLNSPDTPLYDKSLVLYGLDKAKSDIRRMGYTIIVEGQMDLVMSHQAGIKNTVASSGTALTAELANSAGAVSNLNLVRRLSPNVILAFDSDKAGRAAAMRAVATTALSLGMSVKIADIEGGKDPADLVLTDPENWKNVLRNAKHVIEYEMANVLKEVIDPHKLARAMRDRVFPYLAIIESEMDKAFFVKAMSDRAHLTEQAVWEDLKKFEKVLAASAGKRPQDTPSASAEAASGSPSPSLSPKRPSNIFPADAAYRIDIIERRMFGLLELIEKKVPEDAKKYRAEIKKIATDSYEERMERIEPIISDLVYEAEAFFGTDEKNWDRHMKELIVNFEENAISDELLASMNELRIAEKAGEMKKVAELAKKCQVLSMRKAEVAKKRRY